MNLFPFLIGIGKDWYKPILWIILGAILCYWPASCQGKREATIANNAKVELAAEQVKRAAAQAELAATLADMTRVAKTGEEVRELRTIVEQAEAGGDAGPAVAGVLNKLRERNRSR